MAQSPRWPLICVLLAATACYGQICRRAEEVEDFEIIQDLNGRSSTYYPAHGVDNNHSYRLRVSWRLPRIMNGFESFVFTLTSAEGPRANEIIMKRLFSFSEAGCQSRRTCSVELILPRYFPGGGPRFQACGTYRMGLQITRTRTGTVYCNDDTPSTVWKRFTLPEDDEPAMAESLRFVNSHSTYWQARLEWQAPEENRCIHAYRITYFTENSPAYDKSTVNTPQTSITLRVQPCQKYFFEVTSVSTSGRESSPLRGSFITSGCFSTEASKQQPLVALAAPGVKISNFLLAVIFLVLYWTRSLVHM